MPNFILQTEVISWLSFHLWVLQFLSFYLRCADLWKWSEVRVVFTFPGGICSPCLAYWGWKSRCVLCVESTTQWADKLSTALHSGSPSIAEKDSTGPCAHSSSGTLPFLFLELYHGFLSRLRVPLALFILFFRSGNFLWCCMNFSIVLYFSRAMEFW